MKSRQLFKTYTVGPVFVVELLGVVSSLADSSVLQELEEVRSDLRTGGQKALVVDLAKAAYFGSSLLEAIRLLWNDLSACGGRVALCNASEVGREVLEIAKFDHVWPLVNSRDEAIKIVTA
ncbi:MAG: STAS domain-containing protein [Candidatus Saccharimonas sp.]|nr:STAS domain-containing protein [Planctomycetaceae bacterium]